LISTAIGVIFKIILTCVVKVKFHYAILVAYLVVDLQRAGIWPITSSEPVGLRQVCDQPWTCLRPG